MVLIVSKIKCELYCIAVFVEKLCEVAVPNYMDVVVYVPPSQQIHIVLHESL